MTKLNYLDLLHRPYTEMRCVDVCREMLVRAFGPFPPEILPANEEELASLLSSENLQGSWDELGKSIQLARKVGDVILYICAHTGELSVAVMVNDEDRTVVSSRMRGGVFASPHYKIAGEVVGVYRMKEARCMSL